MSSDSSRSAYGAVLDCGKNKLEETMGHALDVIMVLAIVAVLVAQAFFPPQ